MSRRQDCFSIHPRLPEASGLTPSFSRSPHSRRLGRILCSAAQKSRVDLDLRTTPPGDSTAALPDAMKPHGSMLMI